MGSPWWPYLAIICTAWTKNTKVTVVLWTQQKHHLFPKRKQHASTPTTPQQMKRNCQIQTEKGSVIDCAINLPVLLPWTVTPQLMQSQMYWWTTKFTESRGPFVMIRENEFRAELWATTTLQKKSKHRTWPEHCQGLLQEMSTGPGQKKNRFHPNESLASRLPNKHKF